MSRCATRQPASPARTALVVALVLLACGAAAAAGPAASTTPKAAARQLDLRGFIAVPLRPARSGLLTVAVRINGIPARFVLDTGASGTVVEAGARRRLQMVLETPNPAHTGTGAGGRVALRESRGNLLQVGGYRVTGFRAMVMPLDQVNAAFAAGGDAPIDGVLGADVLRRAHAVIDYARHFLYLRQPAPAGSDKPGHNPQAAQ